MTGTQRTLLSIQASLNSFSERVNAKINALTEREANIAKTGAPKRGRKPAVKKASN